MTISKISSIQLEGTSYEYTGKSVKPAVVVKDSEGKVIAAENYTVTYSGDGVNVGTYTATVKFKGSDYSGSSTLSYIITVRDLKKCGKVTLKTTSYTYNGKAQTPAVVVKNDAGVVLVKDKDYQVTYSNNKNIGKAKVTITGKGNYNGTITADFTIKAKNGTTFTSGSYKYKVTSEGTAAFAGVKSTKTTKVTIGTNITSIGKSAFEGCTKLSSVTIGSAVTRIGDKAFKKCTSLKSITIPSKVTTLGKEVFYGCKNLKTITVKSAKLKSVGKNAFKSIYSKAVIKVPKSKLKEYQKLLKGKGQGKNVKIK